MNDAAARAASPGTGGMPEGGIGPLVPELSVSSLDASLAFWCATLGFAVAYDRPAAGFAYLTRGRAHVMLCERNGRWETGLLERPLGRGINLQIAVDAVAPLVDVLIQAGCPLYEPVVEAWYRAGAREVGQREFLVQDPDGYLLRFAESLGTREPASEPRS